MARIGPQGFFDTPSIPAAMDIPNTGAVLDDQGTPQWEPQVQDNNQFSDPTASRVIFKGMGILERLREVDDTILQLILERKELIDEIQSALDQTKKMTETLSYVEAAKEVIENG